MSADSSTQPHAQSAAAPSPFPPIADYAFLSNCHTGALVAADGAIDWLCVPAFDSPSVFGSLLDRQAGFFRLGPFGISHPAARSYEPGTNVLVTSWKTPTGWIVVRDALTMGPRGHEDAITPHTRPPADDDGDHMLVRTVECIDGHVEIELVCEPVFDYGREPAAWALVGDDAPHRGRDRRRPDDPSPLRPRARHRGQPRARAAHARGGTARVLRAVLGRGARRAGERRRGRGEDGGDDALLARLARPRAHPRPPLPRPDPALGAGDQGPDLHADRRHGRGAHDVAAGDAGRRAQLGLPLHLDARHHLHAAGAALAQPRLGGRRVHAVRRRRRADRGRVAADHVRDRRPSRSDRDDPRRPLRLRRRAAGADRQRRVRPAPERRLRRGARLDPAPHASLGASAAAAVADRRVAGRVRDEGVAGARPGDLGGPRQAAAVRLVEADGLGRARPGRPARRDPRRPGEGGRVARDGRGDPRRHPRARCLGARRAAPALRHRRARRVGAARRDLRVPARRATSGCGRR